MSDTVTTTNGAVRPVPTLTKEQMLEFIEEPLKQLPADWRLQVWDFWAYFEAMLPTQLALCTRLRRWRDRESLTLDELQRAMDDLRTFDRSAEFQFGTQVLAALADQIKANRRAQAEADRRKEQTDRMAEAERLSLKGMVGNLAEAFRNPSAPLTKPAS